MCFWAPVATGWAWKTSHWAGSLSHSHYRGNIKPCHWHYRRSLRRDRPQYPLKSDENWESAPAQFSSGTMKARPSLSAAQGDIRPRMFIGRYSRGVSPPGERWTN